ncbi:MAG: hypothetical protein QF773_01715 [Lentisphaeria bacterium]|jgi:N-acetylglucosamine-6-sulfatase|nr:hypothetical protein [Lentisphaeria bacterium]
MSQTRPNILYIMSDDHSAEAISCYGSRLAPAFQTPNLDQIGRKGLRLTSPDLYGLYLDHCLK